MIPDFKTYIRESSTWGDMLDRGAGEKVKQEDILKDIYDRINEKYQICFVNSSKIEYNTDSIYVPLYKFITLSSYASLDIYKDHISFSTLNLDKYKPSEKKMLKIPKFRDDIHKMYDVFKDKYSPEVSTFDGMEHWYNFGIYLNPNNYKKCDEIISFILDNLPSNEHILKLIETK